MLFLILVVLMLILIVSLMNGLNKNCNTNKSVKGIKYNIQMWKKILKKFKKIK